MTLERTKQIESRIAELETNDYHVSAQGRLAALYEIAGLRKALGGKGYGSVVKARSYLLSGNAVPIPALVPQSNNGMIHSCNERCVVATSL